jgi:hypothetical protein
MGVLYSLYDALVSINVPNEKALAVADAMEQDMIEKLVTRTEFKAEMQLVRQEMSAIQEGLSKDMSALEARLDHKMDLLGSKLTIALGGLMVVLIGVMATLLRIP